MGYRLNLDEPIFMAGPKPMRIEFGIHQRWESCATAESDARKNTAWASRASQRICEFRIKAFKMPNRD